MLFSSIIFIFYFLPITMLVYYLIPKEQTGKRNIVLLVASLFFYSWGEPVYLFLMLYSAFFNYFMAIQIHNEQKYGGTGRRNLLFTVVVDLLILGFFKYFGFLMDTITSITGWHIHYTSLALPIGISFYTFQAMSYVFDVYKGKVAPQYSLLKFSLYLSFFPQLIAGPIVKYRDVELQIDNRETTLIKFGEGSSRFILGLGKKVILANALGSLYTEISSLPHGQVSVILYWIGIAAYTLQIYFDFSGYSDMAIGLGKMFGFVFDENFNYPYIASTITDFWRRWHMSLSTWFREYVYIPLGGNRVKVHRHILNLLIVWSLTGLWHGASWNFVLWGAYFGVLLILEKYVYGKYLEKAPNWFRHAYAIVIVMVSWVFFSITDISKALSYLAVMFGLGKVSFINVTALYYIRTNFIILAVGACVATPYPIEKFRELYRKKPAVGTALVFAVLIVSVAYLVYGSYNPFLYFRF